MTKKEAIDIFGKRPSDLADAIGVTRSAISHWRDEITNTQQNIVIGVAIRKGIKVKKKYLK